MIIFKILIRWMHLPNIYLAMRRKMGISFLRGSNQDLRRVQ